MLIGIICWIVLGLFAGFIASDVVNGRGEGALMDTSAGHRRRGGRWLALQWIWQGWGNWI